MLDPIVRRILGALARAGRPLGTPDERLLDPAPLPGHLAPPLIVQRARLPHPPRPSPTRPARRAA